MDVKKIAVQIIPRSIDEAIELGYKLEKGEDGMERDYAAAKEIYTAVLSDDYMCEEMSFYKLLEYNKNKALAANNLGWMYQNGYGCEIDINKAKEMYRFAADELNAKALLNLGSIADVEGNYELAEECYQDAIALGEKEALINLGNLYFFGKGREVNYKTAYRYYKIAAVKNVQGGFFYLGLYAEHGYIGKPDPFNAFNYYEVGAFQDDAHCWNNLGSLYGRGLGIKKDNEKAFDCYYNAAILGDYMAYANIGWMCENGYGTDTNYQEAVNFYSIGAQHGDEDCLKELIRLSGRLDITYETAEDIKPLISYLTDLSRFADKAYEIAAHYHEGQVDKAGKPYIDHPIAVSRRVNSFKEIIVALLHDTIEDTAFTLKEAEEIFGHEIADALDHVTHRVNEPYMDYVKRASENPIALMVKLADLTHNMDLSRLENPSIKDFERLEKKYKPAMDYLRGKLKNS